MQWAYTRALQSLDFLWSPSSQSIVFGERCGTTINTDTREPYLTLRFTKLYFSWQIYWEIKSSLSSFWHVKQWLFKNVQADVEVNRLNKSVRSYRISYIDLAQSVTLMTIYLLWWSFEVRFLRFLFLLNVSNVEYKTNFNLIIFLRNVFHFIVRYLLNGFFTAWRPSCSKHSDISTKTKSTGKSNPSLSSFRHNNMSHVKQWLFKNARPTLTGKIGQIRVLENHTRTWYFNPGFYI